MGWDMSTIYAQRLRHHIAKLKTTIEARQKVHLSCSSDWARLHHLETELNRIESNGDTTQTTDREA